MAPKRHFVTLYQGSLSKIYFTPAVNFSVLREWILEAREGRSEIKISFTLLRSEKGNENSIEVKIEK